MKNLHTRVFVFILVLLAGAAFVLWKMPMRFGLDVQGGMRVVLRAQKEKLPPNTPWGQEQLNATVQVIENRVNALGVSEPLVYGKPAEDRIVVELPGLKNQEEALKIIQSTAKLEFRGIEELDNGTWRTREASTAAGADPGYEEIYNVSTGKAITPEELQEKLFSKPALLDGSKLKPNSRADIGTGKPIIHFEFKDESKGTFEDYTRTHINKPLAIFLDNKLISAPNINDVIPGIGIIEGNFTPESAKTLAGQLNAGALPVPLEQQEMTKIEPTLGKIAVRETMIAGTSGLALVLVAMLWWYRVPGLIAGVALLLYALFNFALFKMIPVTLTVPGLAGFILSIGMAVDANILIFERMREERASGKSLRASIEAGFKRAFSAIADSNICTLITCYLLYYFGSGQVRGFAVTLAIGVLISMFTAITCSRTFLLLLATSAAGQRDNAFTFRQGPHPRLNVMKRKPLWFILSAIAIVPGLIAWGMGGIKQSIEFTGGTEFTTEFTRTPNPETITRTLAGIGHRDARVIVAEGNRAYITTASVDANERPQVTQAIEGMGARVLGASTVSGAISAELSRQAILAIAIASALIVLYLALRFSIPNFTQGLKFGFTAVAALLHDAAFVWGAFALLGLMLNWQIDSLFVTAMLTVIGFSVHDTIIIFDRLRENIRHAQRGETFDDIAERSIQQTYTRSIRTSASALLPLVALLLFGGPTLRGFVTALVIGMIVGVYSSIFIALPMLAMLRGKRAPGEAIPAMAGGGAVRPGTGARPTAQRPTPRPVAPTAPKPTAASTNGATDEAAEGDDLSRQTKIQARKRKRRM